MSTVNKAEIGKVTTQIGEITTTQTYFITIYNPTENDGTYGICFRCAWHIGERQVMETDVRDPQFRIKTKEECFNIAYEYMMQVEKMTVGFKATSLF